jgi:class 3 adenylate cyclase
MRQSSSTTSTDLERIMPELPRGTVTFLFTEIEGSTAIWERHQVAMASAVERHLALLRTAVGAMAGCRSRPYGNAVPAAFPTASDAVAAPSAQSRPALS